MESLYYEYKNIWHCKNSSCKLKQIKKVLKGHLKGYDYESDNIGNIFVGNFDRKIPCLVAHIDSVFDKKPENVTLKQNILTSDTGLGGDDKCGIITILEVLKENKNINAIFTIDEEIGGIGANSIKKEQIKNVSYFVEVDRRGNNDIINNIGCDKIASDEFIGDIKHIIEKYKFKIGEGAYTDVLELSLTSRISSINLSAGYYNPHTKDEYVNLKELKHTIDFVKAILKSTQKQYILPEIVYNDDLDSIDLSYAINETNDIKALLDIGMICDYKDISSLIYKAYEIGLENRQYLDNKYYNYSADNF